MGSRLGVSLWGLLTFGCWGDLSRGSVGCAVGCLKVVKQWGNATYKVEGVDVVAQTGGGGWWRLSLVGISWGSRADCGSGKSYGRVVGVGCRWRFAADRWLGA